MWRGREDRVQGGRLQPPPAPPFPGGRPGALSPQLWVRVLPSSGGSGTAPGGREPGHWPGKWLNLQGPGRPDPVPSGLCWAGRAGRPADGLFLPGPAPRSLVGIKIAARGGRRAPRRAPSSPAGKKRRARGPGGGQGSPATCRPGTEPGLAAQLCAQPAPRPPPRLLLTRLPPPGPEPGTALLAPRSAQRPGPAAPPAPARPRAPRPRPIPAAGLTSALGARRPARRPRPAHAGGWGGGARLGSPRAPAPQLQPRSPRGLGPLLCVSFGRGGAEVTAVAGGGGREWVLGSGREAEPPSWCRAGAPAPRAPPTAAAASGSTGGESAETRFIRKAAGKRLLG